MKWNGKVDDQTKEKI